MFSKGPGVVCRDFRNNVAADNVKAILDLEKEDRRRAEVDKYRRQTGGGPPVADVELPDPELIRETLLCCNNLKY